MLLSVTTERARGSADGSASRSLPFHAPRTLRLGGREWPPGSFGIMAVINRTPDSFFDQGATYDFGNALAAADRAVAEGADILDLGGVKAGPGEDVSVAEEIRRVADLVAVIRAQHPAVVISVDTWRAEVGEAVAKAGADLLNDAWGGADPQLADVAAAHGLGLVCSHAGGLAPRTRPHRPAYEDLLRLNELSRRVCAPTGSSSTRHTTSGRTPGSRWNSPGGRQISQRPGGRC
jgi:dihydropteroate synthase